MHLQNKIFCEHFVTVVIMGANLLFAETWKPLSHCDPFSKKFALGPARLCRPNFISWGGPQPERTAWWVWVVTGRPHPENIVHRARKNSFRVDPPNHYHGVSIYCSGLKNACPINWFPQSFLMKFDFIRIFKTQKKMPSQPQIDTLKPHLPKQTHLCNNHSCCCLLPGFVHKFLIS